ncbi:unnamed protein product [Closterium sp. NIES-53]
MRLSKHECFDDVVTCYSTPSSATIGGHPLPFLFPDLPLFHIVAGLVTHLRSLDTGILPERLASTSDASLALHPTSLTVDLFETSLTMIESRTRAIAASSVGDALTRALVIVKGGGGVGAWEGSKAGGAGSGGAARGGAGPRGTVVTQLRQHLH